MTIPVAAGFAADERTGRAWPRVIVAVALALAILLAPAPTTLDQLGAVKAAWRGRGIATTGHSVISHVSKCDVDVRTLPEMIGADARSDIARLDYPGETLFEGLNFAAMAVKNPRIRDIVLFVSVSQASNAGRPALQTQAFGRLFAGPLAVDALAPRLAALTPITAGTMTQQTRFTYRGTAYPAYDQFNARYLAVERNAAGCPEPLGVNPAAIEALYWNNYVRTPLQPQYLADMTRIAADAAAAHKRLLIAVLPIDLADARTLSPALAAQIAARRDAYLAQLRAAGLAPLDLTDLLPASGYADRWCGCGHLADTGRQAVAAKVAQNLAGALR